MRLFKQLLTNNNCYKAGVMFTPKGIMWHSTGAANNELCRYIQPDDGLLGKNRYNNHWNVPKPGGKQKCVHAFIGLDKNGAVATYQTLPWNMRGWHAGKSKGNDEYIGFEICEDNLTNEDYFNAVYKEACELTAFLCEMWNLDPMKGGVVICHSEGAKRGLASNHSDVMHWFKRFGKTMDDARRDVKALMGRSATAPNEPKEPEKQEDTKYRVQVDISNLNIRKGPGTNYEKTGKFTGKGVFTIVDTKSGKGSTEGWGKLSSGAGWISLDFCTKI